MSDSRLRGNRLLAALPAEDYERLRPSFEIVPLGLRESLYHLNKPIEQVYFPISGMASILVSVGENKLIEAGLVGNEGMVGLPIFLGNDRSSSESFYQVPGEAARLPADVFRAEVERNGVLTRLLRQYTQAFMGLLGQNGGCNSQHAINERCARWLLHTHDRVMTDQFELTQEFLSQMLGVRRASVSTVMHTMQQAGFISYRRGKITITNRAGLESAACECYRIITGEYERLLGQATAP